jgi:hypothetical protein
LISYSIDGSNGSSGKNVLDKDAGAILNIIDIALIIHTLFRLFKA